MPKKRDAQKKKKLAKDMEIAKEETIKENKKPDILEPILNDTGEPYWLVVKEKTVCYDSGRSIKKVTEDPLPAETIPIFELKPQGLWLCQKCGANIESYPDNPLECYEKQGGCGRNSSFKPITKIINQDLWKLPTWKDIPVEELNMLEVYDDMLALIKKLLIFSEEIEYEIYTLWIISTWKLECWDTVGYPIFIGLPDSGKSRALRIITPCIPKF